MSRIKRNKNDKGATYKPTMNIVRSVYIGLGMNREEAVRLWSAAFPEMTNDGFYLDNKLTIDEVNEILYEEGHELLGNIIE